MSRIDKACEEAKNRIDAQQEGGYIGPNRFDSNGGVVPKDPKTLAMEIRKRDNKNKPKEKHRKYFRIVAFKSKQSRPRMFYDISDFHGAGLPIQ